MKFNNKHIELVSKLQTLILFRNLLENPVIASLQELLLEDSVHEFDSAGKNFNMLHTPTAYCNFAAILFQRTTNLSRVVLDLVLNDENIILLSKAKGHPYSSSLDKTLLNELKILEQISRIESTEFNMYAQNSATLPAWETEAFDFPEEYDARLQSLPTLGYGIFQKYHMFTYRNGEIVPVKHSDTQELSDLIGYDREKKLVLKNTEALMSGGGASNVLLYGDAGTGKSSTVKAVANHFKKDGLRLVEITKHQLYQLPEIIDSLSENPLKFIIFIDDLSFAKNDDNFSTLKSMLEGSVSGHKENIAIYATSNRRHLVKESISDRKGDELFLNDTLQEIMSLSARFGLAITYERPRKEQYLEIVKILAREAGLAFSPEELSRKAEAHALLCGGRSPRVAKQFVDLSKVGITL